MSVASNSAQVIEPRSSVRAMFSGSVFAQCCVAIDMVLVPRLVVVGIGQSICFAYNIGFAGEEELSMDSTMHQHRLRVNGAELAYFERGTRRDDLPSLFFVHATGFHGRVWDYHAEAFPEHHIIALEQRGHGRSEKLAVTDWRTFGEDMAAVVAALDLRGLIGIGHSMGAHAMIDGAAISGFPAA